MSWIAIAACWRAKISFSVLKAERSAAAASSLRRLILLSNSSRTGRLFVEESRTFESCASRSANLWLSSVSSFLEAWTNCLSASYCISLASRSCLTRSRLGRTICSRFAFSRV